MNNANNKRATARITTPKKRKTVAEATEKVGDNATSNNESKCPISYQVILFEQMVGGEVVPIRRSGSRIRTFYDAANPFLARQDALIYASGLAQIVLNEPQRNGLVFDSPDVARAKGYRNYNSWGLEIWMIDLRDDDQYLIYDGSCEPSEVTLEYLDGEYYMLQSLGYGTDSYDTITDDETTYRCINSKVNLVEFDKPETDKSSNNAAA